MKSLESESDITAIIEIYFGARCLDNMNIFNLRTYAFGWAAGRTLRRTLGWWLTPSIQLPILLTALFVKVLVDDVVGHSERRRCTTRLGSHGDEEGAYKGNQLQLHLKFDSSRDLYDDVSMFCLCFYGIMLGSYQSNFSSPTWKC